MMKRAAWQIAALAGILVLVCAVCRLAGGGAYAAYLPVPANLRDLDAQKLRVRVSAPEVIDYGAPEVRGGYIRVPIRPRHAGETDFDIELGRGDAMVLNRFRVGPFHTVYDFSTGGFSGDTVALAAFTAFCLAVACIMIRVYRRSKGPAFYSYATIYAAGFSLFALLTGLMMLSVTLRHATRPDRYNMLSAYSSISGAGFSFMVYTSPFMLAFAVAMGVSNVALLRHERFRPQNVLGIGVSVMLLAGEALAFWLFSRDFAGSEWEWRIQNTLQNVYATAFAYFECMLIGAIVCGVKAARHVPEGDRDYVVILGCRFRRDGTLPPLLRGRVDRAIEFWRSQKAASGRQAVLIPSGGQGPDETMAEAEAMRRYLLAQGIPEEAIRVEDRSRNTFQNMEYSKALIDAENPRASVAYVTTSYHVFRSGVWARLAGMLAEGVGSGTKWWFWPNAFMRECIGLLRNRIRQEILLLVAMIAFFALLSMVLN